MSENEKNMTEQTTEREAKEVVSRNFIEQIIDKDLAEGTYDTVHTDFRRSPTGISISGMPRASC